MTLNEYHTYVTAGMSAERALRRLHSVQSFNANEWECNTYAGYLQHSITLEIRKAMVSGVGMFFPWLFNIFTFAVAFGYGNHLVENEGMFPGNVFPVFFGIVFASASIQQIFVNMDAITGAKLALKPILEIFEQQSPIDFFSTAGKKIEEGLKGSIDFRGVFFRYPTRLNVKVLNSFDMKIQAGETVSLLGDPSSGVLAIPHLIERFYDINKGQILLDGHEIRHYNVRWLRSQIGVVTKNPSFFPVSISDNIRHGLPDVTQDEIEDAAKDANIHDFIMTLPLGYKTVVSDDTAENIGLASGIPSQSRRHGQQMDTVSIMSVNSLPTPREEWPPRDMPTTKRHSVLSDRPLYQDKKASASSAGSGKPDGRQDQILVTDNSSLPGGQSRRTTTTLESLQSEETSTDTDSSLTSQTSDRGKLATTHLRPLPIGGHSYNPTNMGMQKKSTLQDSRDASSRYISGDHKLWGLGYWTDEAVVLTLGQKIQLDIARALVTYPAILLMEDVNNHFEHDAKDAIWRNLSSRRQTILFVTHTPLHTIYTDRVIVVVNGRKVDEGTPKQLREKKINTVFNKLTGVQKVRTLKGLAVFCLGVNKKHLSILATKFATLAEDLYFRYKRDESETHQVKENQVKVSVDQEHQVKLHPLARVLRLQKVDSFYLCLGLLLSVLLGTAPIGTAYVIGHFVIHWYEHARDIKSEHSWEVYDFLYIMLGVSVCAAMLRILLNYCFSFAGTRLTSRVRTMMFEAMLRQNMSFFDKEENRPAVLAHSLTHDPDLLHGMLGIRTGAMLETLTTVIFGLTMALVAEWRTALIITTFGPLTLLGSFLQGKVHLKAEKVHSMHMKEASDIFQEALENITTVAILNMKQMYLDRLETILQNDCKHVIFLSFLPSPFPSFLHSTRAHLP
ncbi:ABC transporter B family member 2-like [Littorina saxatilis]|uniref:ABC transporter B family member 2-like n=1 Tax=Littorina saxatilis TaxID=31220 RepID=UPI0038B5E313